MALPQGSAGPCAVLSCRLATVWGAALVSALLFMRSEAKDIPLPRRHAMPCSTFQSVLVVCLLLSLSGCCCCGGTATDANDFFDNPEDYAGSTVMLSEAYPRTALRETQELAQSFGHDAYEASFFVDGKLVAVSVPINLDVPNAGNYDRLAITFYCADGSTMSGNELKSVRRNSP